MKSAFLLAAVLLGGNTVFGQVGVSDADRGHYTLKTAVSPAGRHFRYGGSVGINRNINVFGPYHIIAGVDYSRYKVERPMSSFVDPETPFLSDFGMLEFPLLLSVDIVQHQRTAWRVFPQIGYTLGASNHERRVLSTDFVTDPFYHFLVARVMSNMRLSQRTSLSLGPHVKSGKLYRGITHSEFGLSMEFHVR